MSEPPKAAREPMMSAPARPASASGPVAPVRASLFVTCLGDHFYADAAASAVRLLRKLGVEVDFPEAQTCCGQPAFNAGRDAEARRMARHTLEVFRESEYVVLPSGSCASMLRRFYAHLFDEDAGLSGQVADLAGRTFELAEFLVRVLEVTELGQGLEGRRIAYHHGCHALRELGIREEPLALMANAGAEVVPWEAAEECCGFGGLFSVSFPQVSAGMADRKLDTLAEAGRVDLLTSADCGCLLQLSGRMRRRGQNLAVRHLADVLWEAAGGDS